MKSKVLAAIFGVLFFSFLSSLFLVGALPINTFFNTTINGSLNVTGTYLNVTTGDLYVTQNISTLKFINVFNGTSYAYMQNNGTHGILGWLPS